MSHQDDACILSATLIGVLRTLFVGKETWALQTFAIQAFIQGPQRGCTKDGLTAFRGNGVIDSLDHLYLMMSNATGDQVKRSTVAVALVRACDLEDFTGAF